MVSALSQAWPGYQSGLLFETAVQRICLVSAISYSGLKFGLLQDAQCVAQLGKACGYVSLLCHMIALIIEPGHCHRSSHCNGFVSVVYLIHTVLAAQIWYWISKGLATE